jgi:hypothetical protein
MDAKIKEMIERRQDANLDILTIIEEAVMKYPGLRFGQILVNLGIIEYELCGDIPITKDPFNEESVITLNRIKKKSV